MNSEKQEAFSKVPEVTLVFWIIKILATTLSYGALKLPPLWDALYGDPPFEKIVTSLAPKELPR